MNSKVDTYLKEGCGRCPNYQTPDCKVHFWPEELIELRRIVLSSGLKEEYKWSQPCYTLNGKNVLIVTAYIDFACISFFKGSLLKDPENQLVKPGRSSQAARQLRFTKIGDVLNAEKMIKSFIDQAIEIEKAGKQVAFKKNPEPLPEELKEEFKKDSAFKKAFEALTPGRQRGYILYFSQPKQSKTRFSRIEKYRQTILDGKGINDNYRMGKK